MCKENHTQKLTFVYAGENGSLESRQERFIQIGKSLLDARRWWDTCKYETYGTTSNYVQLLLTCFISAKVVSKYPNIQT